MPAADDPAGELPAGDTSLPAQAGAAFQRPKAILFDGLTRDYVLDANGRYVAIHPVDAKVQSALMFLQGKIPSSAGTGNELDTLADFYGDQAPEEARRMVRASLTPITDARDITIISIDYEAQPQGPAVEVHYTNNRLPGQPVSSAKV